MKFFTHKTNLFCMITFLAFANVKSFGQNNGNTQLLDKLIHEDSATVTTLATYPQNIRTHILELCAQPNAVLKMENLQKRTATDFKNSIKDLPLEDQKKIWSISRYPKLITRLNEGGKKSVTELEKIAEDYPADLRPTILDLGQNNFAAIAKMESKNQNNQQAFLEMAGQFPEKTKTAMTEILKYPEVISLLSQNMRTATLAGEIYKQEPLLIQQKLDSLSVAAAEQNARELEAWKRDLENDPEAKKEMDDAAKEFAKEQGYTNNTQETTTIIVNNYVYEPYPYWFGYPWWYNYPCWYDYPWWYHTGYYWGPYGIIYFGFPSPYYSYWYYHNPYHHYHYSHFTNHCVNYHYGHRQSLNAINRETSSYIHTNENHVRPGFFANDAQRPDRIKELGKFEMNYNESIKTNPGKTISREDFHKNNAGEYPNIKPGKTINPAITKPVQTTRPTNKPVTTKPSNPNRPPVVKPKPTKPAQPPRTPNKPVSPKVSPRTTTPRTNPPRKK